MPSPLSVDLRERVVAAVAEGTSFHRAAARFGVSVSSVSRWSQRFAQQGHVLPKPTHGDDSLPAIEVHISDIKQREKFRRTSMTAGACVAMISGQGFPGYLVALRQLVGQV